MTTRPPPPRRPRRWRRAVLALLPPVLFVAGTNLHVLLAGSRDIHPQASVPAADCIVVPGARIHLDGRPYDLLEDRLRTAAELFRAGKAGRILVSGRGTGIGADGSGPDEVSAMHAWLLQHGVPDAAVVRDPLGLRTLDTMYRVHDVYGFASAIVVTNGFHLARAVFLGQQHQVQVAGVEAPPGVAYAADLRLQNQLREVAARAWAWLDVFVLRTGART